MRSVTATTQSLCTVGLLVAAGLGLTGCVPEAGGYAALDRPAEARDQLPAGLPGYAARNYDMESARLVAEDDGRQLYLLRNAERVVCLLVYSDPGEWFSGCGGDHFKLASSTVAYEVWADGHAPVDTGVQLSPNVYARG